MTSALVRVWVNSFSMRSTSSWLAQRFSGELNRSLPISSALALVETARRRRAQRAAVARAHRGLAAGGLAREGDAAEVDHRVLHGDLDVLALAGAFPLMQGGQNTDGGVQPGARVADGWS